MIIVICKRCWVKVGFIKIRKRKVVLRLQWLVLLICLILMVRTWLFRLRLSKGVDNFDNKIEIAEFFRITIILFYKWVYIDYKPSWVSHAILQLLNNFLRNFTFSKETNFRQRWNLSSWRRLGICDTFLAWYLFLYHIDFGIKFKLLSCSTGKRSQYV